MYIQHSILAVKQFQRKETMPTTKRRIKSITTHPWNQLTRMRQTSEKYIQDDTYEKNKLQNKYLHHDSSCMGKKQTNLNIHL